MEHSPHASLGCLSVASYAIQHMEGSKQTNAPGVLSPSWLCVDSQPPALPTFLHSGSGEGSPGRLPGPRVDPSRLIIILDQPASRLKSLREGSVTLVFLLPFPSPSCFSFMKRHTSVRTPGRKSHLLCPPASEVYLSGSSLMLPRPHIGALTKSEVMTELREQLEDGVMVQYLADMAGPRGHTWNSLLALSAARIAP